MQQNSHQRRTNYEQNGRYNYHQSHSSYPRQSSYARNSVLNGPVPDPYHRRRQQNDEVNNWGSVRRDNGRIVNGPAVYERKSTVGNQEAGWATRDGRRPEHDRHNSEGWGDYSNDMMVDGRDFVADSWGRDMRRRRDSFPEPSREQYRMDDAPKPHLVNGRGHYERPQKRDRSAEQFEQSNKPIFPPYREDYDPPIYKKPRLQHNQGGHDWDRRSGSIWTSQRNPQAKVYAQRNPLYREPPTAPRAIREPLQSLPKFDSTPYDSADGYQVPLTNSAPALKPMADTLPSPPKEVTALPQIDSSATSAPVDAVSAAQKCLDSTVSGPTLVEQFFDEEDKDRHVPSSASELPSMPNVARPTSENATLPLEMAKRTAAIIASIKDRPISSGPPPALPLSPVSRTPPSPLQDVTKASFPAQVPMDIDRPGKNTVSSQTVKSRKDAIQNRHQILKHPELPQPRKQKEGVSPVLEPYEFLGLVGVGAYGKVFKAKDLYTGRLIALKKIKSETQRDGFPVTTIREIKLLQTLHHDNVVALQEVVCRKGALFLNFEYVEHDLVGLLKQSEFTLLPEHIKSLTRQLCEGLAYVHSRSILHRDLKTSNLLVTGKGVLKLGDFGLARVFNKRKTVDYTNRVCTYWYRAPELMLGETIYGPEIDIWSAGCIILEMWLKEPPFCAEEEVDQLQTIYSILGSPTDEYCPQLMQKPWYILLPPSPPCDNIFGEKYGSLVPEDALSLAENLIHLDGSQRLSATEALADPYFLSDPAPVRPDLSTLETDWHEYEYQTRRRKERQAEESHRKLVAATQN